jgi:hypothetical protein
MNLKLQAKLGETCMLHRSKLKCYIVKTVNYKTCLKGINKLQNCYLN